MGCYTSTIIPAPANEVWALFRNFHDLSWADGVITKTEPVGDAAGDEIGAKRILNDAFHETLRVLDDENRTIEYSINLHISPAFVARPGSCSEMGCLRPEGRGARTCSTSSTPMGANAADCCRFPATAESW